VEDILRQIFKDKVAELELLGFNKSYCHFQTKDYDQFTIELVMDNKKLSSMEFLRKYELMNNDPKKVFLAELNDMARRIIEAKRVIGGWDYNV
jgi:hypothetical protein